MTMGTTNRAERAITSPNSFADLEHRGERSKEFVMFAALPHAKANELESGCKCLVPAEDFAGDEGHRDHLSYFACADTLAYLYGDAQMESCAFWATTKVLQNRLIRFCTEDYTG
jgi:hypothetical protein